MELSRTTSNRPITSATAAAGGSLSPAASASLAAGGSRADVSSPASASSSAASDAKGGGKGGSSASSSSSSTDPATNPNFAAESGWAKLTPLARAIARNPLLDADEEKLLAVEVQEVLRLEAVRAELLLAASGGAGEDESRAAALQGKKAASLSKPPSSAEAPLLATKKGKKVRSSSSDEGAAAADEDDVDDDVDDEEEDEEEEEMPQVGFSAKAAAALALASVSSSSKAAKGSRAASASMTSGISGIGIGSNSTNGPDVDPKVWAAAAGLASVEELKLRLFRGAAARDRMVGSNTRLVISIARRYIGKGLELEDLVLEGLTGLMRGIEKFDPTRGFKFSTYAHWWIRQAVTRAISEQGRIVRLPVHLHEMMARVKKAEDDLSMALGRQATEQETAAAAGLTVEKIAALRRAYSTTRSIDDPGGGGGGGGGGGSAGGGGGSAGPTGSAGPSVAGGSSSGGSSDSYGGVGGAGEAGDAADLSPSRPSAFARAIASSLTADVESVLSETLGARESGVLRMRYGLDDGRPKTLEEIGAAYSVTRERIRQIEAKALLKLRAQPERCSTLSDYADDGDGDDIFGAQWKSATTKARS